MGELIECPVCDGSGHQFYQEDFRECPGCEGACELIGTKGRIARAATARTLGLVAEFLRHTAAEIRAVPEPCHEDEIQATMLDAAAHGIERGEFQAWLRERETMGG